MNADIKIILSALNRLRVPPLLDEYDIHAAVAAALDEAGIEYLHEAKIAQRCRVDFLAGDAAIEVKRGAPQKRSVLAQLRRYAACDNISHIILIVERWVDIPKNISGKPCYVVGLNRLWGIAL